MFSWKSSSKTNIKIKVNIKWLLNSKPKQKKLKIMKIKFLSIIATVFISNLSNGQITLEHNYITDGYFNYEQQYAFHTENSLFYYTLNTTENKVLIYDSAHTLYKIVTLDVGAGFTIRKLFLPTDKLFNSNNKIEFIIISNNGSNPNKMTLFDEDGENLYEFGNRWVAQYIKIADADYKLLVGTDGISPNYYDIYDLSGTLNINQQQSLNKNEIFGFPNPTKNKISITNNLKNGQVAVLEIFDSNGRKVIEKNIVGESGEIDLDVSQLSSGIYIYKLNGQTNKFLKQ